MSVPTVTLNDGTKIPAVGYGLGTANFGKDATDNVLLALKEGYYHIDTAEVYANGTSLGKALKSSGTPREKVFITAKCIAAPRKALEKELADFGVDSADLFLIHSPEMIKPMGITAAWAECEALLAEGKTKSIGVSNFRIKDLELLLETAKVVPSVNQIEVHPYLLKKTQPLLDFCASKGITIEVYGPLTPLTKASGGAVDAAAEKVAKETGYNPGQVLLKWAQGVTKGVILTTSSKSERLQEQLKTFTTMPALTQAQLDEISVAGATKHVRGFMTHMDE